MFSNSNQYNLEPNKYFLKSLSSITRIENSDKNVGSNSFPRPGLSESDDTVNTRLDGIAEQKNGSSVHLPDSSVHLPLSSVHLPLSSVHLKTGSVHLKTGSEHLQRLRSIAKPIEGKRKVPVKIMEDVILKLCKEDYLALKDIAEILNRTPETLRIHYLNRMVKGGLLELRYPDKPSHPDQGYRTHK